MATFEVLVEGLTGLTISSSDTTPTQAELTQFLKDGVVEVINRIIQMNPQENPKFCTTTHDDSDSGITVTGKTIAQNLKGVKFPKNQDVVMETKNPISESSGVVVL